MPDASLRKHTRLRLKIPSKIFRALGQPLRSSERYRGFETGERFIRIPPLISAFSPSAAPLAEATRRLAGHAHNYPGLRRFAGGSPREHTAFEHAGGECQSTPIER
jgi:hypothetical protein